MRAFLFLDHRHNQIETKMFALDLIYELTLAERNLAGEGQPRREHFLKAIHVVSSMARTGKSDADLLSYVREFYVFDLNSDTLFDRLKNRLQI